MKKNAYAPIKIFHCWTLLVLSESSGFINADHNDLSLSIFYYGSNLLPLWGIMSSEEM